MVDYNIPLSRTMSGRELTDVLRATAKKLKWHYSEEVTDFSVSYGSVKISPTRVIPKVSTRRLFGDSARVYGIMLNSSYASLKLHSFYGLSDKNLEKLATALRDTIQNNESNKPQA